MNGVVTEWKTFVGVLEKVNFGELGTEGYLGQECYTQTTYYRFIYLPYSNQIFRENTKLT